MNTRIAIAIVACITLWGCVLAWMVSHPTPIVQLDTVTHKCVKVIQSDDAHYTCTNLPPKYTTEYVAHILRN